MTRFRRLWQPREMKWLKWWSRKIADAASGSLLLSKALFSAVASMCVKSMALGCERGRQ